MLRFRNKILQAQFEEDGFVVLPLLEEKDLAAIKAYHEQINEGVDWGSQHLRSFVNEDNLSLTKEIDIKLKGIVLPKLQEHLELFDPIMCSYLTKPSKAKEVDFHQDLNLVDEERFESANLWIALQKVDKSNGALRVVPGTHHLLKSLRVSPSFPYFFEKFKAKLKFHTKLVVLEAGSAVLFNHRLIHGSFANTSEKDRLAVIMNLKSKDAPLYYYYRSEKTNTLNKYDLDLNSYMRIQDFKKPNAPVVESIEYTFPTLATSKFNIFMLKRNPIGFIWNEFKHLING